MGEWVDNNNFQCYFTLDFWKKREKLAILRELLYFSSYIYAGLIRRIRIRIIRMTKYRHTVTLR